MRRVEPSTTPYDAGAVETAPARTMQALRRIVRLLRSSNTEARQSGGVTTAQLFVLRHIAENPGRSLDDVVRKTLTTQSTASEVVGRLLSQGLIVSRVSAADRRRVALSPTEAGLQVVRECGPSVQDTLIVALGSLPLEQQEAIATGLADWLTAAKLQSVAPSMFFEPDANPFDR
jgi:DNA-binding MarR family transcriptional regulator